MTKEGYQPLKIKKATKIIPPNTGSNVQMRKDGYTWEDLDKAWWEGFDNAKNKMEKRIAELENGNKVLTQNLEDSEIIIADLKEEVNKVAFENGELKAQIEKMKCCENCNNYCHRIDHRCNTKCKNLSEWEIKEK